MVDRKVTVTATMDASGMVKGAKEAETAVERAGKAVKKTADDTDGAAKQQESAFRRMAKSAKDNEQAWRTAGTALTAFGTVTVAALAASAKAAVDWESAFAGVRKTVDDSEAGYAALSGELREMARTLPAAHAEIAGVAEAAGQLGIQRESIAGFTRTMIDLGETTNLSAGEAATALARFANIMGTSQDEFDNIGSAVVDLGNNFATTEREIVEMGLRLAGAGRQAGLTEGEVLGLATALSSVGIEAQAGGTAFSRVLIEMGVAVDTQSDSLRTFAEVSGMAASQFSTAWEEDAGSAIAAFVAGLGEMESSGQSIQPILEELGMTDIRIGDALRRASGAADLFTGAMSSGNAAYAENVALTNEAQQRYATTAAQLQVFKNNVVDASVSLGEAFLPALQGLASYGADAAKWLGALPEPLQKVAAFGGAAAGSASLLAGGFLLLAPRALETYTAFQKLGIITPRTTTAIRNMATVLRGPWGIAIAAAGIALGAWVNEQAKARADVEELTTTLDEQTGALTANSREWATKQLMESGALEDARRLGAREGLLTDALMGQAGAREELNALIDEAINLGGKYAGSQQDTFGVHATNKKSAEDLRAEMERLGLVTTEAQRRWELYNSEVEGAQGPAERLAVYSALQADAFEANAGAVERTADVITRNFIPAQERAVALGDEAAESYAKWVEELSGLDAGFINTSEAMQAVEEETRAWAEAQAEATDNAEDSWEDFVEAASFSLGTFIEELEKQVAAQSEWETNMLLLTARLSESALKMLEDMGPAGAQAAAALVDATDEEITRFNAIAEQRGGEAGNAWGQAYTDALSSPVFKAAVSKYGQEMAEEIARQVAAGELTVAEAVEQYDLTAYINVEANPEAYNRSIDEGIQLAAEADAVVPIDGDSRPAQDRLSTLEQIVRDSTPSITILADDALAQGVRLGFQQDVNGTWGTVGIDANAWNAYSVLRGFLNSIPRSVSIGLSAIPVVGGFLGSLPGFMSGGYTGDGDSTQLAGAVHQQEFVSTAETTSDPYNRQALEFMHSGRSIREWTPPMQGSAAAGGGASTSGQDIVAAVAGALAGWQPVVKLGDREVYGVMKRSANKFEPRTGASR
jgi:TP901 family phage tail tape measure protein